MAVTEQQVRDILRPSFCSDECYEDWMNDYGDAVLEGSVSLLQHQVGSWEWDRKCPNRECGVTVYPALVDGVYILARGGYEAAYLGFGAREIEPVGDEGAVVIIGIEREHSEWQLMRMMSGLVTASNRRFDDLDEARDEALKIEPYMRKRVAL